MDTIVATALSVISKNRHVLNTVYAEVADALEHLPEFRLLDTGIQDAIHFLPLYSYPLQLQEVANRCGHPINPIAVRQLLARTPDTPSSTSSSTSSIANKAFSFESPSSIGSIETNITSPSRSDDLVTASAIDSPSTSSTRSTPSHTSFPVTAQAIPKVHSNAIGSSSSSLLAAPSKPSSQAQRSAESKQRVNAEKDKFKVLLADIEEYEEQVHLRPKRKFLLSSMLHKKAVGLWKDIKLIREDRGHGGKPWHQNSQTGRPFDMLLQHVLSFAQGEDDEQLDDAFQEWRDGLGTRLGSLNRKHLNHN